MRKSCKLDVLSYRINHSIRFVFLVVAWRGLFSSRLAWTKILFRNSFLDYFWDHMRMAGWVVVGAFPFICFWSSKKFMLLCVAFFIYFCYRTPKPISTDYSTINRSAISFAVWAFKILIIQHFIQINRTLDNRPFRAPNN